MTDTDLMLGACLLAALFLLIVLQRAYEDVVTDLRKERAAHDRTTRALVAVEDELSGRPAAPLIRHRRNGTATQAQEVARG